MKSVFVKTLWVYLIIAFVSCSYGEASGKRKLTKTTLSTPVGFVTVTKVVDGDTYWIIDSAKKEIKIRLIGIDAPESRNSFKKHIGHYGKESKIYLKNLILGKKIKLEYDVDKTDQYGRTLAYAYLSDGTFVNTELVKNGYALVMTIPPNVKYAEILLKHQNEARINKRGLWKE
jgi:micrococcal nuclease